MISPRTLNVLAAVVHAGLFIGFARLFQDKLPKSRESITLYRMGIDLTALAQDATNGDMNAPQKAIESGKINVKDFVLAFFGVTAIAHALYASDFLGRGWYTAAIARGWNPFRWVEYGISASIMAALVASFSGVRDQNAVLLIAGSTAAMQGCGFLVERALTASKPDMTAAVSATLVGWLLLVAAWAAILRSFIQSLNDVNGKWVNGAEIKLPDWLWGIGVVQAVFFSCFGLVQLSHRRGVAHAVAKGQDYNFAGTESAYLVLSLAAKASLASVIAYGLVARQEA